MKIELLAGEKVFCLIETKTPEIEFETYKEMFSDLTGWREYTPSYTELYEQVKKQREVLYSQLVDPLTMQISRLRDMGEDSDEINKLMEKRQSVVLEIKTNNPYPVVVEAVSEVEKVDKVEVEEGA